jgi:MATE family multidrug resistance protein
LIITNNDGVIEVARPILQIAGVAQVFYGAGIIFANALQAGGSTVFVMGVEIVTHWLIFLPLTYVFGVTLHGGVKGAWLALPVYVLAYTSMNFLKFRSVGWLRNKI